LTLALVQIALGGESLPSTIFAGATFFGLLSVQAAGAITAIGLLNLLLVGRFLLGAYFIKNLLMSEPISARLLAPEATAEVMLLGFAGVWLGTLAVRRFVRPIPIFADTTDPRRLLSLAIVFVAFGTLSSVAVRIVGSDDALGGIWGLAKSLAPVRIFALPALMLYYWRINTQKWLTHPAVLSLVFLLLVLGVLSSSKQSMAEPLAAYIFMAIARYGWRHPLAWIGIPIGLVIFQFFIFPISQYARQAGAENKNAREAAMATADIVYGYLTEPAYREYIQRFADGSDRTEKPLSYLSDKVGAYGRMAMIGETDRLVNATETFGPTGWDTIGDALLLQVPYFIYPNKPQLGTNNFLGRYTGDLPPEDVTTQVSFGFMANAFNTFGLPVVLPFSAITTFFVLGVLALMASGPVYLSPWSIAAVIGAHQSYVEASFSGQFGVIHAPVFAAIMLLAAIAYEWVRRRAIAHPRDVSAIGALPASKPSSL
jgi:hypothetical protein